MEKFNLDLVTILQMFHQNGDLYGDVPAKKLGNKAPWKAHIRVEEGIVAICEILDNRGMVVDTGQTAYESLHKLGNLYWEVRLDTREGPAKPPTIRAPRHPYELPVLPEPSQPGSDPSLPASATPYRLLNISLKQMNETEWPRNYRLVYILVDGTRTVEKIATMLAMAQTEVDQILRELQSMRILDMEP